MEVFMNFFKDWINSRSLNIHWPLSRPWRRSKTTTLLCSSLTCEPTSRKSRLPSRSCTMSKWPRSTPLSGNNRRILVRVFKSWNFSFMFFFSISRPDGEKKAYVKLTADFDAMDTASKVIIIIHHYYYYLL